MVHNYLEVLYDNEVIETPRLILRKFRKSDASDILEYASDPETMKYLDWGGVKTEGEALDSIVGYYWSKPGIYAIEHRAGAKCIGGVDIRIETVHDICGFGYVLNRAYWNKGFMTETLSAVIDLCFDKLEANRVEAYHYAGNEGSGHVMAKCGMEMEGVGKQERNHKGVFRDAVHYGITRDRWLNIKNN